MAICGDLRQNTAVTIPLGKFVDRTDGATAETAMTVAQADVLISKNGATFAQKNESSASAHMQRGYYACALNATDTNTLGILTIDVDKSEALPVRQDYRVLPDYEYDAIYGTKILRGILSYGTAQSATGTTIVLPAAETFGDDTLNGATVVAQGSTQGYAQSRAITDYVGSTDTATVDTWTVTPSGTITEVVFAGAPGTASDRTALRDAILNWEPFTGYNLARLLRAMGIVLRGTASGLNTTSATYTAPAGGATVTATVDADGNRSVVSDTASGTP